MCRRVVRGLVVFLVVATIVCAPITSLVFLADDDPAPVDGESVPTLNSQIGNDELAAAESVRKEVTVIVELESDATLSPERLSDLDVGQVYTREDGRHVRGTLPLTRVRELSRNPGVRAVHIKGLRAVGKPSSGQQVAAGVETVRADVLHTEGVTGENVTVGVIGREFRPSDPSIAGHVGAYRAFDTDGGWVHGTAVAGIVADTAPGATLHLAAVGPSTTPAEYRRAVEWLNASGADVIVDAGSYFGNGGNGTGDVTAIAEDVSNDVVFVTSAGNYANRHWARTYTPNETGSEWIVFGDSEGNALNNGEPFAGRVTASLRWNTSDDYELYLLRVRPGDDEVVAVAQRDTSGSEQLSTRVPQGRYYLAVRAENATALAELELFANRDLANSTPNGSLTSPARADGVLAVGAYNNGSVRPFSSRGPAGNDTGVAVVAPDDVAVRGLETAKGTSYAAPYVAGIAALLQARYPTLSSAEIRAVMRGSARDVGPPGPDIASGHGLVDARAAHDLAAERVLLRVAGNEST